MRNVLHELLPEVLENHTLAMTEVVVHPSRHTNLAPLYQSLQPCRNVYAIAEDVTLLDHDVTCIDADPKAHRPRFGFVLIGACKRFLYFNGAADGIKHTGDSASTRWTASASSSGDMDVLSA